MEAAQATELLAIAVLSVIVILLLLQGGGRGPLRWASKASSGPDPGLVPAQEPTELPGQLLGIIEALPGVVLVVEESGAVRYASAQAVRLGLVRRGGLAFDEILAVAREAGEPPHAYLEELALLRPPLRKEHLALGVRAIRLPQALILLLVEDLSEVRRTAEVRRDFIANVGHELKTPVGAISLLAEALISAGDDTASVAHFAHRLHTEATRLANLINDVMDLSRVQGGDPPAPERPVAVDDVVSEAVDSVRAAAEARHISVVVGKAPGLQVNGTRDQLVTAVRNLLTNAVAYSPEHTKVAVAVLRRGETAEIVVKDQGIGIDAAQQSRIFERFYRVDAARSRATGGTGLGLAIVRNICRTHGGDVSVWSVVDEGSSFSIQLPALGQESTESQETQSRQGVAERSGQ